jgi:hypothetical protein
VEVQCPHCGNTIDIVGPSELKEQFGLNSNHVQHARDRGKFPDPYLELGNRNLWLRATIEDYVDTRSRLRLESTLEEMLNTLDTMDEETRAEARKLLEKKLSPKPAKTPPARRGKR